MKVTDDGGLSANDTVQVVLNDPTQPNRPPVANAGPDQTIFLPTNEVTLDGSGSTDPNTNIKNYAWTKISGPASFNFINANAIQTGVNDLVEGIYQIELKVIDSVGLFSKDTVQVVVNSQMLACDNGNRPLIYAQLIPVGNLSQVRGDMAVAAAGNKIVFAGGGWNNTFSSRVDIYDLTTQTWSTAELCVPRNAIAAIGTGNKIFFAGGEVGDGTWPVDSVDIYDVTSDTWTVSHLSSAGHSIAAAAAGNKVFFAGGDGGFAGDRYRRVDVFDLATSSWSATLLSEGQYSPSAVTADNKVFFAGGATWLPDPNNIPYNYWLPSNKIDILDNVTHSWSTSTLIEGKAGFGSVAVSGKIYWVGGQTGGANNSPKYASCLVEIRDLFNGSSSVQHLSKPSWGGKAVVKGNKIIFLGYGDVNARNEPNKFDIYDIASNTWSIGILPIYIEGAPIISVNNTIYITGGIINGVLSDQVWKLEF